MPTHLIRLNGPWTCEGPAPAGAEPPHTGSHDVTVPATWRSLFGDTAGTARFRRRFHKPTNLEPHERVRIAVEEPIGPARLTLNGDPLHEAPGAPGRFDVTDALRPYNELTVEITRTSPPPADALLWKHVAIEIDSGDPHRDPA